MLIGRVQRSLVHFYALEAPPPVEDFVVESDDIARERVVVRQIEGAVELALELPAELLAGREVGLDGMCQLVEGVSHFVLLAERARRELPTTQLELEMQAELDKWLLLASDKPRRARDALCARMFDRARFLDPAGSERGDRYREAQRLAQRLIARLERQYLERGRLTALRAALRRFYSAGPSEKFAFADAA